MTEFTSFDAYKPHPAFIELVQTINPSDEPWNLSRSGVWLHVKNPSQALPESGWKFHVSSTPHQAKQVLEVVALQCFKNGLSFKFLLDPYVHVHSMSKMYDRVAAGKFITIYPSTTEQFVAVAPIIAQAVARFQGPYIISDRPFRGSDCLYYRYGAILPQASYANRQTILDPDGKPTRDLRGTRYQQPAWIRSPLSAEDDAFSDTPPLERVPLKQGEYTVISALAINPTGGVYLAEDGQAQIVAIKEARKYMGWANGLDSVDLLKREIFACKALSHTGATPKYIDEFEHGGNLYLVEQFIDGIPIAQLMAQSVSPLILYTAMQLDLRAQTVDSQNKLRMAWRALAVAVSTVHAAGWGIGDASPQNFLWSESTRIVTIVDLEGFFRPDKNERSQMCREAYSYDGHVRHGVSEMHHDIFGVAASALDALLPIARLRLSNPTAWVRVLEAFSIDFGLDPHSIKPLTKIRDGQKFDIESAESAMRCLSRGPVLLTNKEVIALNAASRSHVRTLLVEAILERLCEFVASGALTFPGGENAVHAHQGSLGYGSAGVMLALNAKSRTKAATRIRDALLDTHIDQSKPGLFDGFPGIVWAVEPEVDSALRKALRRLDVEFDDLSLHSGLSGQAMALTHFAMLEQNSCDFRAATNICKALQSAVRDISSNDPIAKDVEDLGNPTGLLFGRCGVARTLAGASKLLDDREMARTAQRLLNQELEWIVEYKDSMHLSKNGSKLHPSSNSQHWGSGSGSLPATIDAVLSAFSQLQLELPEKTRNLYARIRRMSLQSLNVQWTQNPSLGSGLSGLVHAWLESSVSSLDLQTIADYQTNMLDNSGLYGDEFAGLLPCSDNPSVNSDDLLTGSAGLLLVDEELKRRQCLLRLQPGISWIR